MPSSFARAQGANNWCSIAHNYLDWLRLRAGGLQIATCKLQLANWNLRGCALQFAIRNLQFAICNSLRNGAPRRNSPPPAPPWSSDPTLTAWNRVRRPSASPCLSVFEGLDKLGSSAQFKSCQALTSGRKAQFIRFHCVGGRPHLVINHLDVRLSCDLTNCPSQPPRPATGRCVALRAHTARSQRFTPSMQRLESAKRIVPASDHASDDFSGISPRTTSRTVCARGRCRVQR